MSWLAVPSTQFVYYNVLIRIQDSRVMGFVVRRSAGDQYLAAYCDGTRLNEQQFSSSALAMAYISGLADQAV